MDVCITLHACMAVTSTVAIIMITSHFFHVQYELPTTFRLSNVQHREKDCVQIAHCLCIQAPLTQGDCDFMLIQNITGTCGRPTRCGKVSREACEVIRGKCFEASVSVNFERNDDIINTIVEDCRATLSDASACNKLRQVKLDIQSHCGINNIACRHSFLKSVIPNSTNGVYDPDFPTTITFDHVYGRYKRDNEPVFGAGWVEDFILFWSIVFAAHGYLVFIALLYFVCRHCYEYER